MSVCDVPTKNERKNVIKNWRLDALALNFKMHICLPMHIYIVKKHNEDAHKTGLEINWTAMVGADVSLFLFVAGDLTDKKVQI